MKVKIKYTKVIKLTSSELSPQSLSPSHCQYFGIQLLLAH